jgi:hypothetical protein
MNCEILTPYAGAAGKLLMIRKYLKSFKYSCHRGRTLYSDDTS